MKNANCLYSQLRAGQIYHRSQLLSHSTAIDRDLKTLEEKGDLQKVGPGMYYLPIITRFGVVPPGDEVLVRSFLKGSRFLLLSPTDYNMLELGTTQTYNEQIVYNEKRHETIELNGRLFRFIRPRAFPNKLTKEYLLVDMLNHSDRLAEDLSDLKHKIKDKLQMFNLNKLEILSRRYGKVKTKKFFSEMLCSYMS